MSTYTIQGLVKHQDSLQGIPDLLVVALDLDPTLPTANDNPQLSRDVLDRMVYYDRLGSVLTDAKGSFQLQFEEADFKVLANEARPDLILAILAPETADPELTAGEAYPSWPYNAGLIHLSPPIRIKAGKMESYSVRVPQALLDEHGIQFQPVSTLPDLDAVSQRWTDKRNFLSERMTLRLSHLQGLAADRNSFNSLLDPIFNNFKLTAYSDADRAKTTYLDVDDDLGALQGTIIETGMGRIEDSSTAAISFDMPAEIARDMGILTDDGRVEARVDNSHLTDRFRGFIGDVLESRRDAFLNCYRTFTEADLDDPDDPPGDTPVEPPLPTPERPVTELVHQQLDCATCPEAPLVYSSVVDQNYKTKDLSNTIDGLSLKGGPTDVVSYHDFHRVQMAFESIWTEVFDEELEGLGRALFEEIVQLDEDSLADRLMAALASENLFPNSLLQILNRYGTDAASGSPRLRDLFRQLETRLHEPYAFDIFAPDSINYGLVYTFRQKWEPGPYQVGKLVKTIPLAPKEERSYKTTVSRKEIRALKEIVEREIKGSSSSESTSRAEEEIIQRAINKTSFSTTANGQLNFQMYNMQFGMETGMESERFSQSTKKNFRENVLKAAQEYRNKTKIEVETTTEESFESVSKGKIFNPNEEISVTYLFYELQRQFDISEELHRVRPVVMVAFDVPKPHEIDNDWIKTYAWILRRMILDESFLPALDYAEESLVGSEIMVSEMKTALQKSQVLVDEITRELQLKNDNIEKLGDFIEKVILGQAGLNAFKDTADFVHKIINPLSGLFGGLFGGDDSGPDLDEIKDYYEAEMERAEKERAAILGRLREAENRLHKITEQYGQLSKEFLDKETALYQLRIHLKNNILYYMQGIWGYEVEDQRFFRLYNLDIDWIEPDGEVTISGLSPRVNPETGALEAVEGRLTLPAGGYRRVRRKLVDVADVDNLLGFKGNYALFPAREPNYLHLFMMQDYINTQTGGLRDPDAFAEFSTQDLIDFLKCLRNADETLYARQRDAVIALINERQRSPRREKERVVIPSDSLYIESLPGSHPVLEDFKLVHRAIDVKKVQAEVRGMELQNARYGGRILSGDLSDPEVDKQIRIEGDFGDLDLDPEA